MQWFAFITVIHGRNEGILSIKNLDINGMFRVRKKKLEALERSYFLKNLTHLKPKAISSIG